MQPVCLAKAVGSVRSHWSGGPGFFSQFHTLRPSVFAAFASDRSAVIRTVFDSLANWRNLPCFTPTNCSASDKSRPWSFANFSARPNV